MPTQRYNFSMPLMARPVSSFITNTSITPQPQAATPREMVTNVN